jgi:hypothetical protein
MTPAAELVEAKFDRMPSGHDTVANRVVAPAKRTPS